MCSSVSVPQAPRDADSAPREVGACCSLDGQHGARPRPPAGHGVADTQPLLAAEAVGAMISVSLFLGAPGIMSASPYAGAGFPPTFAIPQAAGTQTLDLGPHRRLCMPTHLSSSSASTGS